MESMSERLPPHFIELVADAALKSYWRRGALRDFLRRCGVKDSFLATWSEEETKRSFLARLFPLLERSDAGSMLIRRMASFLSEQTTFPDLQNWEDSGEKHAHAERAVAALRAYLIEKERAEASQRQKDQVRKQARARREEYLERQVTLEKLSERLAGISKTLGSQRAGYKFQEWFFDLLDYYEVDCRRPYCAAGRQIDGSITIDGTTYLVELKFTALQADAPDVDVFFKKVHDKADNTMGILVSISGFSTVAVAGASVARTPLLLMDHSHLYLLLAGVMTFSELVNRLRRHASQTSQAYLRASDLSG